MKVNKIKLTIFIILAIVLIIVAVCIFSKKYTLVINDADNIKSVISQKNTSGGKIEVSSKTLISEIVAAISSERTTKQKSEGEIPNVEEYYTITFKDSEQKIYMYIKDGVCYIEEPLNGIYKITQEEYDKIMQYLYF
ncbi:MAG: DUF5301 domain-containing protein [Clostridia bacterium]|nr:DUF5301 domain-containing protein [Clostridia bacterium]